LVTPSVRKVLRSISRSALILAVVLLMVVPASAVPGSDGGSGTSSRADPPELPPPASWEVVDTLSAMVEIPPQDVKVLRVDHENITLEPVDWYDPVKALKTLHGQAVDRVEPWLKRDLAVQLNRMGSNGDRFARLIINCQEDKWVDEIAFSVAHTPPEVLSQMGQPIVLQDNAEFLYGQDGDLAYADLVERTGEDGDFTTVSYLNWTGARHEYPREIYYWYIAHARVFWETPAKVAGKSLWRKAYWDEITYDDSNTLRSWLTNCGNIIEAANASTVWMQMNMEFGYGTNPLQPVQVILERYGSCGQYSITTASSLKAAMIPARITMYPASDHQWCEVYIDGHWMHVDASNDVAGNANLKEPNLIRRTKSVNFNDAGVFERGWKPYMSATSTFRSDDVVMNTIDITAPDPQFGFRETGMTNNTGRAPHKYTETSTVHITVTDDIGDPIEGAYVGIYRIGHDIYNPGTPDYPHFANLNYTNATGEVEFELGLQGYCGRCDDDHYYGALVLSRYNQATNDFYTFSVPEENQEYSHHFRVTGDASRQDEPTFSHIVTFPEYPRDFRLDIDLEAWGRQRHTHGEWGQYEMFNFRTSFDHTFPSDIDLAAVNRSMLDSFYTNNGAATWDHVKDAESLSTIFAIPHEEDIFVLLANTDSHYTTKVVNITVDLSAPCKPQLSLLGPDDDTNHSTDAPFMVQGTVTDYIDITDLRVTFDDGGNWTGIIANLSPTDDIFIAYLNVSHLDSGDSQVRVRATNSVGVWREASVSVFMDADDPELEVRYPMEDDVRSGLANQIGVQVSASDNRHLETVHARLQGYPWVELDRVDGPFWTHEEIIPLHDEVGAVIFEARATDGVGRTTLVRFWLIIDILPAILELHEPLPDDVVVVGQGTDVTVSGSAWDDIGIHRLSYRVNETNWTYVTESIGDDGDFSFDIPVSELEEGEYQVEVSLRDQAWLGSSYTFTIIKDITPPNLLIDPLDPYYNDDDPIRLSGFVLDDHGVQGMWVSVDGGPEEELVVDLGGGFRQTLPSGPDDVGVHVIDLRTVDSLGNEVRQTITYQVVDETDPTVSIDAPIASQAFGRGVALQVSGTALDNVAVISLTIKVGSDETQYDLANLDPQVGHWAVGVNTQERDLGQLTIQVMVEDAAGNTGLSSVTVNLVDRTDPEVKLLIDPQAMPKATKGKPVVVASTFNDDVGVTKVEYRVDGWSWIPVPAVFPCEGWDIEVPTDATSTGNHMLEVRVTDAAGNDVVVSSPFEVVPVPEESTVPLGLIAGVVVAAVVVLVLVYMLVLRRDDSEGLDEEGRDGSPVVVDEEVEPKGPEDAGPEAEPIDDEVDEEPSK
jgi:hypothetical protein